MSDSHLPDGTKPPAAPGPSTEPPAAEPHAAEPHAAEPERGLGPIEAGVAGLFGSFEKGVLNLIDDGIGSDGEPDGPTGQVANVAAEPAQPREVPAGRTYEEALPPIRWKRIFVGLLAAAVLVAAYFASNYAVVRMAADDDDTRQADVIVVLGAAQFDGTPSPVFANRLDHAFELWQDDLAGAIITTGANQAGDRFTEGFSGYLYLRELGVPDEALITVVDGTDTWEQMTATANQMVDRDLTSALLVSDGYHNYRLREIADEVGMQAWVSPTNLTPSNASYVREATAVSLGRVLGYRRLSAFGEDTDQGES